MIDLAIGRKQRRMSDNSKVSEVQVTMKVSQGLGWAKSIDDSKFNNRVRFKDRFLAFTALLVAVFFVWLGPPFQLSNDRRTDIGVPNRDPHRRHCLERQNVLSPDTAG